MEREAFETLREILVGTTAKYLTVNPRGLILEGHPDPIPSIKATIVSHGAARTLYRGGKPHCRSLNALHAMDDKDKRCRECYLRQHCTPQVRVDLVIGHHPYRLLLAYTSARHFLEYLDELKKKGTTPEQVTTSLLVIDRGRWGELRFSAESKIESK